MTNYVLGRPCSKGKYGIKNIGSNVCAYIKEFSAFIFHRCCPVFLIKYCIVLCFRVKLNIYKLKGYNVLMKSFLFRFLQIFLFIFFPILSILSN